MNHYRPLLVEAKMATSLAVGADGAPQLDGVLLDAMLRTQNKYAEEGTKLTRDQPPPEQDGLPLTVHREWLNGWYVARISSPILPIPTETLQYVNRRFPVEECALVDQERLVKISTTDSWTKSYRLPLRTLTVPCVRWFAFGNRREMKKLLQKVDQLGKKRSIGNGRVAGWELTDVPEDYSWYAPHPMGTLLMRPLPKGSHLPADLVGWKDDYRAVVPPLWHPDRLCEVVSPC